MQTNEKSSATYTVVLVVLLLIALAVTFGNILLMS